MAGCWVLLGHKRRSHGWGPEAGASVTRESLIFPRFLPLPVRRSLSAPNTVRRDKAQRQVRSWPPGPDGLLENRRKWRRRSTWQAEDLSRAREAPTQTAARPGAGRCGRFVPPGRLPDLRHRGAGAWQQRHLQTAVRKQG